MMSTMHNTKINIKDAQLQPWCEGCLVISEADARTIWVYDTTMLQSPMMKTSANIANQAIKNLLLGR